jgi:hypothetical protein
VGRPELTHVGFCERLGTSFRPGWSSDIRANPCRGEAPPRMVAEATIAPNCSYSRLAPHGAFSLALLTADAPERPSTALQSPWVREEFA